MCHALRRLPVTNRGVDNLKFCDKNVRSALDSLAGDARGSPGSMGQEATRQLEQIVAKRLDDLWQVA
jgi:hypothetical protein